MQELSDDERVAVYHYLLRRTSGGRLPRGLLTETAERLNVSESTVHRVWRCKKGHQDEIKVVQELKRGGTGHAVASALVRSRSKKLYDLDAAQAAFTAIDPRKSITITSYR